MEMIFRKEKQEWREASRDPAVASRAGSVLGLWTPHAPALSLQPFEFSPVTAEAVLL
jgi:hypothetical protein